VRRDPDVFLVDDLENEPEREIVVKRYYKTIFDHELDTWMTDRSLWPTKRGLRTFLEWFDIDIAPWFSTSRTIGSGKNRTE